jgi:hypothetical protein
MEIKMPYNFRIAVLGDSVAWGQGLADLHKYAYILKSKIDLTKNSELIMMAHSGAKIGSHYIGSQPIIDSEVPYATPTIFDQIDLASDPSSIDLVIINGGINDIGFPNILNPLTKKEDLKNWISVYCYHDMKNILIKAVSVFNKSSCKFLLNGYYPILSNKSDVVPQHGTDQLLMLLNLHCIHIPLNFDRDPLSNYIISQSMQFFNDSETAFTQAVSETISELHLHNRIYFVPSPFSEDNALFAPNPWLFGIGKFFAPQDEKIGERKPACEKHYSNPFDIASREVCYFASVGHPNIQGANEIAKATLKILKL